jgi:hypothetical protein
MSKMSPPVASNVAGKSLQLDDFPQKNIHFQWMSQIYWLVEYLPL